MGLTKAMQGHFNEVTLLQGQKRRRLFLLQEKQPETQSQEQEPRKMKQRGRLLASVLESLRNVFQWTTTSIGSGMKQSESFLIMDNGESIFHQ